MKWILIDFQHSWNLWNFTYFGEVRKYSVQNLKPRSYPQWCSNFEAIRWDMQVWEPNSSCIHKEHFGIATHLIGRVQTNSLFILLNWRTPFQLIWLIHPQSPSSSAQPWCRTGCGSLLMPCLLPVHPAKNSTANHMFSNIRTTPTPKGGSLEMNNSISDKRYKNLIKWEQHWGIIACWFIFIMRLFLKKQGGREHNAYLSVSDGHVLPYPRILVNDAVSEQNKRETFVRQE